MTRPRRSATEVGRAAEDAAVAWLEGEGFSVLDRNLRLGPLEIDIVAQRGDLVVACEVRTRGRGSFSTALGSVDAKKRRTLARAAERLWNERLAKRDPPVRLRIDVAAVTEGPEGLSVEYVPGAITLDEV